ncbi:hypothetical protein RR42_m3148 [Cupriavidus basilensis]|uniref:Uncharacterized protein n=1 Tax=Cupriavidus basilensis TaxID=68895 RepID=A0A0C4Y547_9BURK|nr:hypothetical protein RR42_m3148 [Cupriavidus basilensis]
MLKACRMPVSRAPGTFAGCVRQPVIVALGLRCIDVGCNMLQFECSRAVAIAVPLNP